MIAQRYRMNVGTIVEADMLKVRLVRSRASKMIPRGGRILGAVEEHFIETLVSGDTFVFAGEILRYEALVEDEVYVSRAAAEEPKVPSYEGGKFPLSTYLADRVRKIVSDRDEWRSLPDQVRGWLQIQERRSLIPRPRQLLVETFPRADKHYLICYPFEGRLAHQTLGMLLTRRLERARLVRSASWRMSMHLRSGVWEISHRKSAAAGYRWRHCSTKICSAMISKPGLPNLRL
jgi:ATP-dependent Lhr-like helicase